MSKKHNCEFYHSKIEKQTHFHQKIYKLSKTNIFFSRFEGTRGEKQKQIFRTLVAAGANCNKRNEAGFTSLHRSAYKVEGPQFLSLKELT